MELKFEVGTPRENSQTLADYSVHSDVDDAISAFKRRVQNIAAFDRNHGVVIRTATLTE